MDVVYLDFSKAFDSMFLEKLATGGLNGWMFHWVLNWLDG